MSLINVTVKRGDAEHRLRFDLDPERWNERIVLNFLNSGRMYEPDVAEVFNRAIQPGDTVFDIGANVGIFTILASRLVGPEGSVAAFEPAPDNLARLAHNLSLNDATNVRVVEQPASNQIESVTFHLNSDNDGGHALWDPAILPGHEKTRANAQTFFTRTTTIDAEVARLGLAPPRLIKIDTEGAEHRILEGAAGLLREFEIPYIIAEMHEFGLEQLGSSQARLRGFMAEFGYDTYVLYFDGSLPKLVPPGTKVASRYFINLLFSTPEDVAALWPLETHDPEATAPPRPAPGSEVET